VTHGHTSGKAGWSPTYVVWHSMCARCRDAFRNDHGYYYGKGIRVCARWRGQGGFERFLADMGERPEGMTLGRKDASRDYGPDNCEWQTRSEQNMGLRSRCAEPLTAADGTTRSIAEWAGELGVKYRTMLRRLQRGWSVEEACSVRYRKTRRTTAVSAAREEGAPHG